MLGHAVVNTLLITTLLSTTTSDTRLVDAAMHGDRQGVRLLLEQGVDVSPAQGDGMTALHWAAFQDDLEMVRLLLAAGANVSAVTRIGALPPLFLACINGNREILEALLEAGADANSRNANGTTALMMAASAGRPDAVKVLLDYRAEVDAKEARHGQTALMFAAALDRHAVVRLLMKSGADPKVATSIREVEKVRFDRDGHIFYPPEAEGTSDAAATEKDASGDDVDGSAGVVAIDRTPEEDSRADTATEIAARSDLELLGRSLGFQSTRFLLAAPRSPRLTPPMRVGPDFVGGMTALLFAAREGHSRTARALLESGADINQVNADKFSPLVMAIINGHLDLAKFLLDSGADSSQATLTGLTALYATIDVQWAPHAAYPQPKTDQETIGYLDLMRALLERGADPNAVIGAKPWFRSLFSDPTWVNPVGATPFWRAAQSSDIAAMRLLIDYGADPEIATVSGHTPLMAASGVGWASNWSVNAPVPWIDAVKYCVRLGNDVNAVDALGYTPLHGAAYIGNNDMAVYLVAHGGRVDAKSKAGDSPADMANGPWRFGLPRPDTLALLEELGSPNSDNCRSDKCVVAASPLSPAEQVDKDGLDGLARAIGLQSAVYLIDAGVGGPN